MSNKSDQETLWSLIKNVKDSKVTQLFKMAKAAVTGEPPKNMGEHKELRVS